MTLEQTLYVTKVLLRHYGEHEQQDDALIAGALVMLEGAQSEQVEHAQKRAAPKPKKKDAPKKREPFDIGKLRALYEGGWSSAMIAEEMGVSDQTVRNYAKKEGLKFGKK